MLWHHYGEMWWQSSLGCRYSHAERIHPCRSKRLQQAVKGISRAPNPELMMEDTGPETPEPARKRSKKAKPGAAAATPGVLAA